MREDHMEAIDKIFPDGYIIIYTCPDGQIRMGMHNPLYLASIQSWYDLLEDSKTDEDDE